MIAFALGHRDHRRTQRRYTEEHRGEISEFLLCVLL